MRKSRSAIVLQRTEHRIGIDLITGSGQVTATVIATEVIADGGNCAAGIEDAFARSARVQDGAAELQGRAADALCTVVVDTAAITSGRVPAQGAVGDVQTRAAVAARPL